MVMDGGAYLSLLARQGLSAQEARETLVEKLSALWETVFGDGPEYTSVFFDTAFFSINNVNANIANKNSR